MNLRLVQALYHDEWMTGHAFDPDANTNAVIAALDFYKSHGVLMINVSCRAGRPDTTRRSTDRTGPMAIKLRPGKGNSRQRVQAGRFAQAGMAESPGATAEGRRSARHDRQPDVFLPGPGRAVRIDGSDSPRGARDLPIG